MGFDKDDTRPIVDISKRTTRVNLWMGIAIVVFFIVAGIVVFRLWSHFGDPALH